MVAIVAAFTKNVEVVICIDNVEIFNKCIVLCKFIYKHVIFYLVHHICVEIINYQLKNIIN